MQTIDFLDQLFVLTERIIIITHFTSSQYWLIPEKHSLQWTANIFLRGKTHFQCVELSLKSPPMTGRGRAWEMSPTVNITLYQDIIHWPNLHYKLYQYPAPLRLSEAPTDNNTDTVWMFVGSCWYLPSSKTVIFAMHILAWLCLRPNDSFVEN